MLIRSFLYVNFNENNFSFPYSEKGRKLAQAPEKDDKNIRPQGSIVTAIHKVYDKFSAQEKQVADLVLESPGELSVYAASELARLAGVSNATITRFVRRAGFGNYEEMRIAARDARNWGAPLFQSAAAPHQGEVENDTFLSRFAEAEVRNLTEALNGLKPDEMNEITDALVGARNLVFMGFRNSYFLASYARTQFLHFRGATRIVPGPGETVAERTSDLGSEDVIVIIGLRRIVGLLKQYMKLMHDREVPILLVTDSSARVIPAYARWIITCPVETPHIFDSYSGVQAVLRLLAYESYRKLGKASRTYMERMEALHSELGEFE
ncbi:MurR/RpiR family transcriptional regulator [Rhodobacteraceae bacterium F11138]|nr:MurR/RpiR family transcriptional regulator [Rhodobacteraceae bacterium F11138]